MTQQDLHDTRRWGILATLVVAQLMVVRDAAVVNSALPSAPHELGGSNNDRQWIITASSLTCGTLLVPGGELSGRFAGKRTLIIGLVGFAAACAVGGAAQVFLVLAAGRLERVAKRLLARSGLTVLLRLGPICWLSVEP